MCAGAIVLARIPTVVYGAADPQRGGHSLFGILDHPALIHRVEVVAGILADTCLERLQGFFRQARAPLRRRCRPPHQAPRSPPGS